MMLAFLLAMTVYPKVQRKAQKEIAHVVGKDRLPSFDDRGSLPYLECILTELYRYEHSMSSDFRILTFAVDSWACPVPLGTVFVLSSGYDVDDVSTGIPHLATADDEYRGYHITKGTVIISNIWFVCFSANTNIRNGIDNSQTGQ